MEGLKEAIREKRLGKLMKRIFLLQYNAPVNNSKFALHKLGFESQISLPNSPDLASRDFHLSPNVKNELRGRKFNDDSEVLFKL